MSEPLTQRPAGKSTARSARRSSSGGQTIRHHAATLRIDAAHQQAAAADTVAPVKPAASGDELSVLPVSYPQHSGTAKTAARTSRIQLRLSRNLVAILKAFAKAGQRPSRLVETSLWSDPQMRDAALLLGIKAPEVRPRRLNRIRPKNK